MSNQFGHLGYLSELFFTPYQMINDGIDIAKTTSTIEILLSEESAINIVGVKAATEDINKRIFATTLLYARSKTKEITKKENKYIIKNTKTYISKEALFGDVKPSKIKNPSNNNAMLNNFILIICK